MFPFNTFVASFSPFFLRNKRKELSLGRGMGYYFSVWGIVILVTILVSIVAGWIFVTPERVTQWSAKIPEFSVTIEEGILTETGLPEDPYIPVDEKDFMIFISKTLTEIPADKEWKQGFFILRDRAIISQAEQVGQKIQQVTYAEVPELKNAHFDKTILSELIISELFTIKRIASMIITFVIFFISIMMAVWYCAWSFFWGLIVFLVSKSSMKRHFTYEQSLSFVLLVFFPVMIISLIIGLINGFFSFYSGLMPIISFILLRISPLITLFAACGYGMLLGGWITKKGHNFNYPFGSIFLTGLIIGPLGIAMNGNDFMSICFATTLLFLGAFGYNHLSFYREQGEKL